MFVLAEIEGQAEFSHVPETWAGKWLLAFRQRGVPYSPADWLGRTPSVAERQSLSRAVRRLAVGGLLERVSQQSCNRLAFVRPTPAGLIRAMSQSTGQVNAKDVSRSLSQTDWGMSLVEALAKKDFRVAG